MPQPPVANEKRSSPNCQFIGWDAPVLRVAVERLFQEFRQAATWDMRDLVVVLPSSLARRRLAELLAVKAEESQTVLYPPQIVTVGALPEQLYVAKYPFASDIVQHLAWMQVLQQTPVEQLQHLLPLSPAKAQVAPWLELGKVLASIHRELASDRLDFALVAESLGDHAERSRWDAMAGIQQRYLECLDNLELWDIQTARLRALEWRESKTTKSILVVGCVDLNQTQRGFLQAVGEHVDIWIAAPATAHELFDDFGCLDCGRWQTFSLEIPAETLLVGNTPGDQADLTAACLAEFEDRHHVRDITLGLPDKSLVTEVQHRLDLSGVKARYGAGRPLNQSEPAVLLALIGKYIESRSFPAFAALVRHPAIENLWRRLKADVPQDWLAQIDEYYQAALPRTAKGFLNSQAPGAKVYRAVSRAIERWLRKLDAKPRKISDLVQPLLETLSAAYDQQRCDLDDPVEGALYSAASQVCTTILTLRDVPEYLQPEMTASELIDWLVTNMQGQLVPEAADVRSIEMLGWLDLALDDAPALIVTGMHDGVVPESVNSDAFLPNNLRRQMGMMDNERRYARDAYAVQVMLRTRQEIRFVVGKANAAGDPLVPSRLLMACPLGELPARVLHLVREADVDVLPAVTSRWKQRGGASRIAIPRPADVAVPKQISVTAFRDYLRCPYRFYLRHVLRLRGENDAMAELGTPQFGVLLHDTLALLQGPISTCPDAEQVQQFLIENLHQVAEKTYGPQPPAAVLIQMEQAEARLAAFAERQAARAAEGWEIRHVEQGVEQEDGVTIGADGTLTLIGRIDRIDYHPETGQWAIWDYKTSESAKQPVAVHWSASQGWMDLQLPLYRDIARKLGVTGSPSLGYIALPKKVQDCGFYLADFSGEQLSEADQVAAEVASRVAAGDFWSKTIEPVPHDDFSRICQTGIQRVSVDPPRRRLQRAEETASDGVSEKVISKAQQLLDVPTVTKSDLPPLLIRASAGTGKTFQLSNRLLQIILSGQDIDSILATTFTRKAAGEIMHRVLQRLALACTQEAARSELSAHLPDVHTSAAHCLAALRRTTAAIHRLRISTLDSFFAQVARTFSFEMALPPGWSAMDPVQEPQFHLWAIGRILDNHSRKTLVQLVRMLAKGESSRQVAEEIRRTVVSGYAAYRLTTQEAWDQLPLPPAPSETAVDSALRTMEGLDSKDKRVRNQLDKLQQSVRTGDWEAVLTHGIYGKLRGDGKYYGKEIPSDLMVALEVLEERATAELLPVRREQTLASYQVLEAFDKEYSQLIQQHRLLAFADVAHYLSQWMSGHSTEKRGNAGGAPAGSLVSRERLEFRLDCGVQHLLLDEFQDTAPDQWRILEPLAKPLAEAEDGLRSIFCVGDTKQAIYGWRGGVAEVFDAVVHSMPHIQEKELRESYRSCPEVMDVVNQVFGNLDRHRNFSGCESAAQAWSQRFPEHHTARKDLAGYVCLRNGPKLEKGLSTEERREAFLAHSARQIADLVSQSSASVGVLFRTNAYVARMIAILRDQGVPASQYGGNPLTDSAAVELILSLVHLADHPGDGICRFHLATSPLAAQLPWGQGHQATKVASWFRREVSRCGLGRAIEEVADRLADQLSWWDQHRLEQLIRLAHQFEQSLGGRLREFEEVVASQRVALPTEAQVKVMTVHGSKGLEYDAVFLPDLEVDLVDSNRLLVLRGEDPCGAPTGVLRYMNASLQAVLPESWQRAFAQHKDRSAVESLCLLYVAMTRARHALYMTSKPASRGVLQQFGSLLQSTLGETEAAKKPEEIVFETGDPQWHAALKPAPELSGGVDAPEARTIRLKTDLESVPVRGLRVATPSNVGRTYEPVSLAGAFSVSSSMGATYGTLIHAFFEQIQWLEDFEFQRDELRQVALATISPGELQSISLNRALEQFEDMLHLESVRTALSKSRYTQPLFGCLPDSAEIDNERAVSLLMDRQLISGTIDRLAVLMKDGQPYAAEIIDFKTDAFDPSMTLLWLEERIEHHRPQLEVYAKVVSKLFRIPPERIATYLVMLSTDDWVRVDGKKHVTARGHGVAPLTEKQV